MKIKAKNMSAPKSKDPSTERRSTVFNEPMDKELLSKVLASENKIGN